jgi:hypothetical protein
VQTRIRGARFPSSARQQVRHPGLMRQHQMRDNIPRLRAIAVCVE